MARVIKVAGSTGNSKKSKPKRITSTTIRENRGKDLSPTWEGYESWSVEKFTKNFRNSMSYYNLEYSAKNLKPDVIKWMTLNDYDAAIIKQFKDSKDWRCSSTMGGVANCLMKGMPATFDEFNQGRNTEQWLRTAIAQVITYSDNDVVADDDTAIKPVVQKTIQDRVADAAIAMSEEIEDHIESWIENPTKFDPKSLNVLTLLKTKEAKAAHARVIKDYYATSLAELEELAGGSADDQLREGYSSRSKKQIRALIEFYKEILSACTMLTEEAKVTRKPRTKKPVAKDKLIAKLKYKKSDDQLKLVSINPLDIINVKELWVYNAKTRKLGKYIADELTGPITIKGTTLVGFDETKSIQKTLRKPAEQIAAFKAAGKIALRKFLEEINAVDTQLTGRINEDIVLLKV
jgi:hypothetical protein